MLDNFLYYQMKWKQAHGVEIPQAAIVLKRVLTTRADVEEIENTDSEQVTKYKNQTKLNLFFEVYPDIDSFRRRTLPIDTINDTITVNKSDSTIFDTDTVSLYTYLSSKEDDFQDYKSGSIIKISAD